MKENFLGEFEELVLLVAAGYHDEAYGVVIMKSLEEHLGRKVNISAVHIALKRMEEKGYVKSRYGGITENRGGRRKKYYTVTAYGKKILDTQHALRNQLYNQIPRISFS